MKARKRFSWTVAGCLIVLAAFVAGCSLDSGNPLATSDSSEDTQWSAPEMMAKKVKINYNDSSEHNGNDENSNGSSKGKGKGKQSAQDTDTSAGSSGDAQTAGGESAGEFVPVQIVPGFKGKLSDTEYITRDYGGTLQLISNDESTQIQVILRTGSVPEDTWMTLTLLDRGLLDFTVKPSMELGKAAMLKVKGTFLVPDGQLGLFHHEGGNEWSKVANAKVSEGQDGIIEIEANVKILLNHFSRYAFGSRL